MPRGTNVTDATALYRTARTDEFGSSLNVALSRLTSLRYGENPHQPAAVYAHNKNLARLINIRLAKDGKGGLSATNMMDVARASNILKYFTLPAVAVMKHNLPSGFATQYEGNTLAEIYIHARDADARSAFGSAVVFNRSIDKATAEAITSTYVEVVAAPEFDPGVMDILESKKDLRVARYSNLHALPKFIGDDNKGFDFKTLPTGQVIVQRPYLTGIRNRDDLIFDAKVIDPLGNEHIVQRDPTQQEIDDMLTAWYVNLGVRSNGIVIVKNGVTLAIGSGQQERVGALEQAIVKGFQKHMDRQKIPYDPLLGINDTLALSQSPLAGSVVSSDGFFPFRDSIDLMARVGITGVVQPGGSKKDADVIDAVNQHGMSMALTLERCFAHF